MRDADFPRQWARTRRFSLGVPRGFAIAADGTRVSFLRSRSGSDPCTCLWLLDLSTGGERLLVDPGRLTAAADALAPEERARRERSRELAGGIVRYSTDRALQRAVFDMSGRLFVVDVQSGAVQELPARVAAVDPRLDPTGSHVAYVSGGALRVIGVDGAGDRPLAEPENDDVTYGLPEFVAAEEMDRQDGYWWSPDGSRRAVARVDVSPVRRWYIGDPAVPDARPVTIRYPVAGTDNAAVTLGIAGVDAPVDAPTLAVRWDRTAFEYLVTASWDPQGLLLVVQSRDQRTMRVLDVDTATGETSVVREDTDDVWLDIVIGVPARLADGALVWTADVAGAKRLVIDGEPVTGPDMQVRGVCAVDGDTVAFSASTEPTEVFVWTWTRGGGVARVADAPGVHGARRAGGTTVLVSRTLDDPSVRVSVQRDGREAAQIASVAEQPALTPHVTLCSLGARELRASVQFPASHEPGRGKLPVLLDPYGGPGHQRVVAAAGAHLESQWFADQGFVVLKIDGRGTPGRGPAWDRAIHGDFATPVLADQVDGLAAAAARWPEIDLTRVAIRGWSFGGYLAALAVLRRPDVFHVAVAGAPVTDDRLYDTHYTERYLGRPEEEPGRYERVSLLPDAPRLERPLLLIHGLSDDNVVVAHTLRLSAALVAAGRPHTVLPLPGLAHSANSEAVTENLLHLELDFILRAFRG